MLGMFLQDFNMVKIESRPQTERVTPFSVAVVKPWNVFHKVR